MAPLPGFGIANSQKATGPLDRATTGIQSRGNQQAWSEPRQCRCSLADHARSVGGMATMTPLIP